MSDSPSNPVPQSVEQLPITLFNGVVLAARTSDGTIWLVLRDLCATLGLALEGQRRRIRANDLLHLSQLRVQDGQQFRTLDVLLLDDVPIWVLGIQTQRVDAEVRERIQYVKAYLVNAVRAAFAQLTSLAPTSPQIEDLRDLDRIDAALQALEELSTRQATIESSQDRARSAFRDLAAIVRDVQTRVQALEAHTKQQLSAMQRGTIYHLVQRWGSALATHQPDRPSGESIRSCWRLFNQRFGVSTYSDLPAARYDEAIQFIKTQYHTLTGQEIDAIEQSGLELE